MRLKTGGIVLLLTACAGCGRAASIEDLENLRGEVTQIRNELARLKSSGAPDTAAPRGGTLEFADGRTRRFRNISGVLIDQMGPIRSQQQLSGKLRFESPERQGMYVPTEAVAEIAVSEDTRKGSERLALYEVVISAMDGQKETFTVLNCGLVVHWADSVTAAEYGLRELQGARLRFDNSDSSSE